MKGRDKEWVPGCVDSAHGYWQEPASLSAVDYVLKQPQASHTQHDGRSKWMWIRLPDGDLILGVYPQGDTYFSTEKWRTI